VTPATRPDEAMHASLSTLRDVAGITGSFVFTNDGSLVAREIPPLFDDAALSEASGRLTRLRDTFAAAGDTLELAVVRFRDYKVYLKALGSGMLCIVADGAVNMPALRMAANLVARRISPALERAELEPMLARPPDAEQPRQSEGHGPPLAPPGMRRFRGRPVG
jgi:predicted regulator of Ras-like GTPase activity (Roadblock/LC7/MglB family)